MPLQQKCTEEQSGDEKWGHNSLETTTSVSSSEYQTTNGPIVHTIKHDAGVSERKESSSAYTRPAGGATSGTSSGTRDYLRVYFGSDITTGTMYGTMSTYYNSVQDFAENLEDFPDFGGGEQLRYLAPMSPGPESPAPASFTAPPQTRAFTAPPAIQPPGPVEGGEEESSTLGTVWYYAWEYGGEWVPLVGSGRGFKRAYDEGSTLGMAWNGFIFGVEATGVGAALGLIGKGGKAAVATSKVAASGLRPTVSGMASAAKAKAVEAVTAAKSTVSDAVSAVGDKLDGLGERLAGLFWGGAKKVDDASSGLTTFGKLSANAFEAPKILKNKHGQLTNGIYTLDDAAMVPHTTGSMVAGKSQFFNGVNAKELTLDAAAYADHAGLWQGNKAKIVFDRFIGVHALTGEPTRVMNIMKSSKDLIHSTPGSPL